jgi:hypothetical protein
MSLRGVKERAGHQRHQIGYARNLQGGSEAGHYDDDRAAFLKNLPVSPEDREKIAHNNADALFHRGPQQ